MTAPQPLSLTTLTERSPIRSPLAALSKAPSLDATTAAILSRPLFETGRRFPAAAATPVPSFQAEEKPKQLRLMGVVVISDIRLALFQVEGDEKPILVGPGEHVAGATIERISRGSVLVRDGDGVHSLTPLALAPRDGIKPEAKPDPDPPS